MRIPFFQPAQEDILLQALGLAAELYEASLTMVSLGEMRRDARDERGKRRGQLGRRGEGGNGHGIDGCGT